MNDIMDTDTRNPHIQTFCRALVEKREAKLDDDTKEKMVEDLYQLYENMLGRNMVAALPEEQKKRFIEEFDKKNKEITLGEISEMFGENIPNPEEVMRKTLSELEGVYFKNR